MASLIAALPWAAPFLAAPLLIERKPSLGDAAPASGQLLSVIIPARNESVTIDTVVRSVLATTYQPIELIVVDDRSTDDTAAQVERLAAEDPRVRLVHGAELPAGWYGKPWACYQGYRAARGDLLLFIDADTCHNPALFGHAVGALFQEQAGLVSALPFQRCITFWERVVMPQVWFLIGLRFRPAQVNRATRRRDVIANGQFILVTRQAYEAAGTHQAVRGEVAEDLVLAQTFLQSGQKLFVAHATELMETRMYRDLAHLIEGWSKNAYLGGRQTFPDEPILQALMPLLMMAPLLFWLAPPTALAIGLGLHHAPLIGPALVATGLATAFWGLVSLSMRIPPWYALAYPLGALATLYIFARSLWRGQRRVEWRGRVYGASTP